MNYEELFDFFKEKSEEYGFGFHDYGSLGDFACRITKETVLVVDKRWLHVFGAVKCTKSPQIEAAFPLEEIKSVRFLRFPPSCEIESKNNGHIYIDAEFKSNFKYNYEIDLKTFPYIGEFKL